MFQVQINTYHNFTEPLKKEKCSTDKYLFYFIFLHIWY